MCLHLMLTTYKDPQVHPCLVFPVASPSDPGTLPCRVFAQALSTLNSMLQLVDEKELGSMASGSFGSMSEAVEYMQVRYFVCFVGWL